MRTGQQRRRNARAVVVACVAVAAGFSTTTSASVASPAPDDPTLEEVRQRVERLGHEGEQANERYLKLVDQVRETRRELKTTRKDVRQQRASLRKVEKDVTEALVAEATESPLGATGELLASEDPEKFIDGLGAEQAYNSVQSDMLSQYSTTAKELDTREQQLEDQLTSIDKARDTMAKEKREVEEKADAAKELLSELEAEQRERIFDDSNDEPSRDGEDRTPTGPETDATGNAATAIAYAKQQLGEPYVYGAAGPDTWDCSGLTGAAWAEAGVSLPRSSSAQAAAGTPVSTSDMQPGDLVFYYSPISHVGLYLGNGQLLHATHPGDVVSIDDVNSMPIATVRRVG